MSLQTDTDLTEDLDVQTTPPLPQTADAYIPEKEPDLLLSPSSSNVSSVKRKLEDTNPNNGVSSKRTKPSIQASTGLPSKKPKHSKPKLTVPFSPILRTSSRIRNKTAEVTTDKTEGKSKTKIPSEKSFETHITQRAKTGFNYGIQDAYKSKTTRAVSPNLSTKARANARQAKKADKGKGKS